MASNERPGLAERIAVAVNSSRLEASEDHETHLDLLAAVGLASKSLNAEATTKAQLIAADLSQLLVRVRYGLDRTALGIAREVFADWLCAYFPFFEEIDRAAPGLAYQFSKRVLHEWQVMRCKACGGGGKQQQQPGGKRMRPLGVGPRHSRLVKCERCKGTGRLRPSEQDRRRALELAGPRVHAADYHRFWKSRFREATACLGELGVSNGLTCTGY